MNEPTDVNTAAPTEFEQWEADEAAGNAGANGEAETEETGADEGDEDEAGAADEGDEEEDEAGAADEGEAQAEKPGKKSNGLEKRFAQLTSEIRELKSKLETKPAAVTKEAEVKAEVHPLLADFDTYEAYNDALMDFKFKEKDAAAAALSKSRAVVDAYQKRAKDFSAKHPDFATVTAKDVDISSVMHDFIVTDEQGPDMAYHLAKQPKELARIMALPVTRHAYELGRIAATLANGAKNEKAPISAAPKPVQPVGRASNAAGPDKEPNPANYEKWDAWFERQAQRKQRK